MSWGSRTGTETCAVSGCDTGERGVERHASAKIREHERDELGVRTKGKRALAKRGGPFLVNSKGKVGFKWWVLVLR